MDGIKNGSGGNVDADADADAMSCTGNLILFGGAGHRRGLRMCVRVGGGGDVSERRCRVGEDVCRAQT